MKRLREAHSCKPRSRQERETALRKFQPRPTRSVSPWTAGLVDVSSLTACSISIIIRTIVERDGALYKGDVSHCKNVSYLGLTVVHPCT